MKVRHTNESLVAIVDKNVLENEKLSWGAKGLFAYIASRPDDHKITIAGLVGSSLNGRDATTGFLNELINAGLVIRNQIKENGKFNRYEYLINQ